MRTATIVVAVLLAATVAVGSVRAYAVDPVKAAWSGKVRGDENHPVSEVITVNFDSLSGGYTELFAGSNGGEDYQLQVFTYPGGNDVTYLVDGEYRKPYDWVRFDDIEMEQGESFTKGKQYEFRFTRSGADSIEFYYDAYAGTEYDSEMVPA